MKRFAYQAVTASGEKVKGVVDAESLNAAAGDLGKAGYTIIDLKEKQAEGRKGFMKFFPGRVTSSDLLVFYFQLYDMLSAGFSLLITLDTIHEGTKNPKLKSAVQDVIERIMKGSNFSDALEHHHDIFPDLFINMVRSGESSGKMKDVVNDYAALYENQLEVREKVAGALFYPIILFVVGSTVIFFLITFAVPKFANIFATADIPLPAPTKMLYFLGLGIKRFWYLIAAGVALIWFGIKSYLRTPKGKLYYDTLMLKMPVFGTLTSNVTLLLFCRTLGMLLKCGVPLLRSIELTRGVVQNSIINKSIDRAAQGLEKGKTLSVTLRDSGQFPVNMVQMISVGEETGNLPGMLDRASTFFDRAVASSVKKLTIAIEPFFLIVMGLAVAFIMASILLPLFKMIDIVKG